MKINEYNQMMSYLTRPAETSTRDTMMAGGATIKFMIDFILRNAPKVSEVGSKISREFLEKMSEVNPENIKNIYRDVEAKLALGGKFKDDVKKGEAPKTDVEKVRAQKKAFDETEKELAKEGQIPVKDQTVKSQYKFTGRETEDDLYDLEEKGIITRDDHNVYSPRYLEYLDARVKYYYGYTKGQMNKILNQPARLNYLRAQVSPRWGEATFGDDYTRVLEKARSEEINAMNPGQADKSGPFDHIFEKMYKPVRDEIEDYIPGEDPLPTKKKRTLNAEGGVIGGGMIEGEDLGSRTGFASPSAWRAILTKLGPNASKRLSELNKAVKYYSDGAYSTYKKLFFSEDKDRDKLINRARDNVVARNKGVFKEPFDPEKKYGLKQSVWDKMSEVEKSRIKSREFARAKAKLKPGKPINILGKDYTTKAMLSEEQLKVYADVFDKIQEWKKDPTAFNWVKTVGNNEAAKNVRRYFTKGQVNNMKLSGEAKKLFKDINIDEIVGDDAKFIKDYTPKYFKKLRPTFGATQASAEKNLKISAAEVKEIAPLFKTKTKRSLEEITKKLNPGYAKANEIDKAEMLQQTTNKVAKYLQFLKGERKAGKLQKPKKTDEIINWIENESSDFRFQEGIIRDMKFAARDKALGLKPGTTRTERRRMVDASQKGFAVDETVGLSATYKNAPGYTEATQILSKDINDLKGVQIDRVFGKVLNEVVEGNTKNVNSYNKKAKQFMKDNPGVDVPIIQQGKNLDPRKYIKHFDSFSPQAQKSILNQAKSQNFVIQTNSKPVNLLYKELRSKGASHIEALGLIATGATSVVGGMMLGSEAFGSETQQTPEPQDQQSMLSNISEKGFKGLAGASLGGGIASQFKTTADPIVGNILKNVAKGSLRAVPGIFGPTGAALATGAYASDLTKAENRIGLGAELALAPALVSGTSEAAQQMSKLAGGNPLVRKGIERAFNLGMLAPTALRVARVVQPLGILSLGAEGAYQFGKALQEEKERIAAMSPEERQAFEEEQTAAAYMGEAENFAVGGRVGMKIGGDPKDKRKIAGLESKLPIDPNMPQDPGRRNFLQKMGIGSLGIGALMTGAVKFAPEAAKVAKEAATNVTTQMTEVPNIIKELYATIKNLGQVTDYSKKGVIKTELGPYELNEYPGGYNITKKTDSDYRYQEESFEVQTDPEYGVIDYEELTVRPDMDGKLKDVDYGVELDTYREIGEDLAKIKKDDNLIKIADEDIAKQIEKEKAYKEALNDIKPVGKND